MPRRPANGDKRKESPNRVAGSVFSIEDPLVIPTKLKRTVRIRVKSVLNQNPYLEQVHVPAVVRLAKLEEKFAEVEEELEINGLTTVDRYGTVKPNPLLATLTTVQNAIVTQERNLAISVPTRNEQIGKSDRKSHTQSGSTVPQKNGAPKLRLA